MLRIGKLTDYGIVLLVHFGREPEVYQNARDLAECAKLPLPTVSKVLKILTRAGILASLRGAAGGYRLARPPELISLADILGALEGPLAITDCAGATPREPCDLSSGCPVKTSWQRINEVVLRSLQGLTLAQMAAPELGGADLVHLQRPPARA